MRIEGLPSGARRGRRRDRHGRGARGPGVVPGPLSPRGSPRQRSTRDEFDDLALALVRDLATRWPDELDAVEFAVEEAPLLPDDWDAPTVPLASLVERTATGTARVVLFRRPLELRCESRADLSALVFTVLVEQVSELLGRPPEEIHPRYDAG